MSESDIELPPPPVPDDLPARESDFRTAANVSPSEDSATTLLHKERTEKLSVLERLARTEAKLKEMEAKNAQLEARLQTPPILAADFRTTEATRKHSRLPLPGKTGPEAYGHPPKQAKEEHSGDQGDFVKSMLFGGLDGIITTFAIVAAAVGGGFSVDLILLLGWSKILADATSMGVGDYLSEYAELQYHRSEMAREQWELDNKPEAEKQEMIEIYVNKGMTQEHATRVVDILFRNKQMMDVMMVDELGIFPPDPDAAPLKNGIVTFVSFVLFGSVPLWLYLIFKALELDNHTLMFAIACVATAITLFALGAINARMTRQPVLSAGMKIMVNGGLATIVAYFVGWGLEHALLG